MRPRQYGHFQGLLLRLGAWRHKEWSILALLRYLRVISKIICLRYLAETDWTLLRLIGNY